MQVACSKQDSSFRLTRISLAYRVHNSYCLCSTENLKCLGFLVPWSKLPLPGPDVRPPFLLVRTSLIPDRIEVAHEIVDALLATGKHEIVLLARKVGTQQEPSRTNP